MTSIHTSIVEAEAILTLSNEAMIRCTPNHKFLTSSHEWKHPEYRYEGGILREGD